MKREIKLSVIIVNFNTGNYLEKCLKSVERSHFNKSDLEIIVVDNASTDNSLEFFGKPFKKNIILIKNSNNRGFAAANNIGIRHAKGSIILILNPDTVLSEDTLDKTVKFMEQKKEVGVLTCEVRLEDGSLDDACHRGYPTPWNSLCQFLGLASLFPHSRLFNGYHMGYQNMGKIHEIDSCTGAFMLVRKHVGETIGWFDEEYFWYGEDLDFCYRVKKEGWRIVYYPFTRIIHYKGISSGIKKHSKSKSTADRQTKIRATKARFEVMRIFYRKHYLGTYPAIITDLIMKSIKIKEKIHMREHKK